MYFVEFKFSELPSTFDKFLERLASLFSRDPNPLVVHIDFNFWFYSVIVYTYPLTYNDIFKVQFNKPTLFYSPSLKRFEVPFNVQERDIYEKCLYLYYELALLLQHERTDFVNSLCNKYLDTSINRVTYKKSVTDAYPEIQYLVQFIRRVLSDDSYRCFHRRLQEIANEVKGGRLP